MILGFDPRYQFVHEDDVVHALEHAVKHRVPGTFNVAGDGVLALSEVAGLLGKPYAPVLPPWGTGLATSVIKRLGVEIPPEALEQMRYGRGVDNRRFKASGFHYQHTSRETVIKLGEHLRIHPVVRGAQEPYRYEREVEDFLRWSPHVKNTRDKGVTALSRDQLAELQRLLTGFADTAGMDLDTEPGADRAAEAERRAEEAEEAAREASKRAARAEKRAEKRAREAAEEAAARPAAIGPAGRALRRPRGRGGDRPAGLTGARGPPDAARVRARSRQSHPGAQRDRVRAGPGRLQGVGRKHGALPRAPRRCWPQPLLSSVGGRRSRRYPHLSQHEAPVVHPRGRPPSGPDRRRGRRFRVRQLA